MNRYTQPLTFFLCLLHGTLLVGIGGQVLGFTIPITSLQAAESTRQLHQEDGPQLVVGAELSVAAGNNITIPIALRTDGNVIAGIGLSIDFDETCLSFDPLDADNSGVPDSVSFDMSPQFFPSVSYDATDIDGEIDIIIADFSPPFAALAETEALINIVFGTTCQPQSDVGQTAAVTFSQQPAVSFSDPTGRSIAGEAIGGSVLILPNADFTPEPTATPTPELTLEPTLEPTATPADATTPQPAPSAISEPEIENQIPSVGNDSATTNEDVSVTIDVLANDIDPDGDALSISAVEPALHGTVILNSNNTLTYIPQLDFHGSDLFAYTASDRRGGEIPAIVRITVRSVNDPPVLLIAPSAQSSSTGDQVTLLVSATDPDTEQSQLTFSAEGLPPGVAIDPATGLITGTLAQDAAGNYITIITVSDGIQQDSVQFQWVVAGDESQKEEPTGEGFINYLYLPITQ